MSGSLPVGISGLQHIKELDISSNRFQGRIPHDFFNTKAIEYLYIGFNQLTGRLLNFNPKSNIKLLHASNNLLTSSIPDMIRRLSNLTSLDLSHNRLTGKIPTTIFRLNKLNERR